MTQPEKVETEKPELPQKVKSPRVEDYVSRLENLPRAFANPQISAVIRALSSHFKVSETLSFEPSGEGEHLYLYIEKIDCNSDWVADQLQKFFKLRSQDMGYAGKKDRYSISRQWFSCHMPGKTTQQTELDQLSEMLGENLAIIHATRHNRKLRKGAIEHNHFCLTLTQLSGELDLERIKQVQTQGVPNYFGYQRFGHQANNLVKADGLLNSRFKVKSRNKRGLYLSSARSYLFNLMLGTRLESDFWQEILDGDCLNLEGSRSYFLCANTAPDLQTRFEKGELHLSGFMPGQQTSEASEASADLEMSILSQYSDWLTGFKNARVASSRRAMRVIPKNLTYRKINEDQAEIEFSLPSGSFATSVLRELFIIQDAAQSSFKADKV